MVPTCVYKRSGTLPSQLSKGFVHAYETAIILLLRVEVGQFTSRTVSPNIGTVSALCLATLPPGLPEAQANPCHSARTFVISVINIKSPGLLRILTTLFLKVIRL